MFASQFLAEGRAGNGTNCERGCTPRIVAPACPTHGYPVTKTRLRLIETGAWLTGEVSLFDGLTVMRFIMQGCPGLTKPAAHMRPECVELVDVDSGRTVAIP